MSLDLEGQSPRSRRGRGRGSGDSENPRAARSAGRALVVFERKRWDARERKMYESDKRRSRGVENVSRCNRNKKKKKPKEPLKRDRGGSNNTIESSVGGNVSR